MSERKGQILTFIDEVPLYADKESALEWAKLLGIKGYHKHKWIEGDVEGYMGGVDHSAAVQINTMVVDVSVPKFESKRKYSVPVAQLNQRLQYVVPPTTSQGTIIQIPQDVPQDVTGTGSDTNGYSGEQGGGSDPGGGGY